MRAANNRASRPFSLNQTGTLSSRHLAQFVAAVDTAHKIEPLFRNKKLQAKYKAGRYHILLATRLLMDTEALPPMNTHDMGKNARL